MAGSTGLVNQARSNYRFGVLPEQTDYLGCAMKIDQNYGVPNRRILPKGRGARAYLFMAEHYGLSLGTSQRQLYDLNKDFSPPAHGKKQWAWASIEGCDNLHYSLAKEGTKGGMAWCKKSSGF